jgi:methylase of polypeptide subunit release factors
VLVRLLLLGVPVRSARVDETVEPELARLLRRAGLLVDDGDLLHGAARIVPHEDLLIASDHAAGAEGQADHVPGVHRPSVALAHLTVRGEGERALDVGTGNGIQALLLARHAATVVATDVNPRALRFAAFNAALNGAEGIEVREGSFFEPVAGERFDLVVANPPYVLSPESEYLFRDSGLRGDAVSELVVRAAPAALEPGGFASLLVSWALERDDPAAPVRGWLDGAGCDAFLLHTSTDDAVRTAALWNRDLRDDPEAYADALDRWLDYYRELGVELIAYGCLVLRRRPDGRDGWFESQHLPQAALQPGGDHVRRLFETQDALRELRAEEELLDRHLRVVADAVVTQEVRRAESGWLAERFALRLERGLPFTAGLDATTALMVRALDGSRPLRDVLAATARESGTAEDPVREAGLQLARQMLEVGFLELAEGDP